MSTDIQRHRAELERIGRPAIERFVARHAAYGLDSNVQPMPSVTNYCLPGWRGHERTLFKYFCQRERYRREKYALQHWASTDLVPEIYADDSERLLSLSWISGEFLPRPGEPGFADVDRHTLGISLGHAVAHLVKTPLLDGEASQFESTYYGGQSLDTYLKGILGAAIAVHQRAHCYQSPAFGASLQAILHALPIWRAQPRILYHQDALNAHFKQSRLRGFFDLEMCRVGCEAMQIGSLWEILAWYRAWAPFCEGFAQITRRDLTNDDREAARAFAHYTVWRYITRCGTWRGNSLDSAGWAAEESIAQEHLDTMERINSVH